MSRPFGVAMLIAGYDVDKGPQLFFSDPSGEFILYLIQIQCCEIYRLYCSVGTYLEYKGKAIGSGSEGAQITLQVNGVYVCCSSMCQQPNPI